MPMPKLDRIRIGGTQRMPWLPLWYIHTNALTPQQLESSQDDLAILGELRREQSREHLREWAHSKG